MGPSALILAGDVGGTKTALALFEAAGPGPKLVRETTLASHELASLEAAVGEFLDPAARGRLRAVCLGVPGPVVDGRVTTTNLPWHVDERRLATALGMPPVKLINDLEAAGHGVLGLPADELAPLQRGTARDGARALIAAGTGLGEALLVRDAGAGERWTVIPSEGGHTDFGPRTDLEIDLLRFLGREFGHVSYERVLSGPGLFNVYRFLRASGFAPESPAVRAELETGDASAVVSERGLAGDDPLCAKALDVFVAVYGAEAANLALKALAVGGVIVAGGIAPKIFPCLAAGGFVAAFRDKGRLGSLLEGIPVHVAMNPRAPLLGAARVAAGLLRA